MQALIEALTVAGCIALGVSQAEDGRRYLVVACPMPIEQVQPQAERNAGKK